MSMISMVSNSITNVAARMNMLNIDKLIQYQDKIASGKRINKAADDAAGLAISKKFETQIRGLQQAIRNNQNGISMIQTAEGGMETLGELIRRGRTLAVQASNDSLTNEDRKLLHIEIHQIIKNICQSARNVEYNIMPLLTGEVLWEDFQEDKNKIVVKDIGLDADQEQQYGKYNIKLKTAAEAQVRTSNSKTGKMVLGGAILSENDTVADSTVAGGFYSYDTANERWNVDFKDTTTGQKAELFQSLVTDNGGANQADLKEGKDYTYIHGKYGSDETKNIVHIIANDKTTKEVTEQVKSAGDPSKIKVDYVITDHLDKNDGSQWDINVADALVSQVTTGGTKVNVDNNYLTHTLNTETKTNDTSLEGQVSNVAGSSITINVAAGQADMQVAREDLVNNSFKVTSLKDTKAEMTNYTQANNGWSGTQISETVLSNNTSTVDAAGKVIVNQTTSSGTFTANSLSVGAVSVASATVQNETMAQINALANTGGQIGDVVQFDISGSNISATKITSFVSDSAGLLTNSVADVTAVQNGNQGDYFYDALTGKFTVKVAAGTDISTGNITYKADYYWNSGQTTENADNSFNLQNISTAKGGNLTFGGGETVTYLNNIYFQDDEFERITLDNTAAIGGYKFEATNNNKGLTYGIASDFYNLSNNPFSNVMSWNKDKTGFASNFSIDYTYAVDYMNAAFNVTENNNGTLNIDKLAGATNTQFIDQNVDGTLSASYSYIDNYVGDIQIVQPDNVNDVSNWGTTLDAVKGTNGANLVLPADATVDNVGKITFLNEEQYYKDIEVDYRYNGNWGLDSVDDHETGIFNVESQTGITPQLGDIVSEGSSTANVIYKTFNDSLEASWHTLGNKQAIVASNDSYQYKYEGDNIWNTASTMGYQVTNSGYSDHGTPTSLKLTIDGSTWLSSGSYSSVESGSADYAVEGNSFRFRNGININDVKAYYITDSNNVGGTGANSYGTLTANTVLGNVAGSGNVVNYTTDSGLFKGFNTSDTISFSVDGRVIEIQVNPSDTVQDLIDRVNVTGNQIYENNLGQDNAFMQKGYSEGICPPNNAAFWAVLENGNIKISSWDEIRDENNVALRNDAKQYGYKGARFNITTLDDQIGPGSYLNFFVDNVADEAVNPEITVEQVSTGQTSTVSSDNLSNFFNNTYQTQAIPGFRLYIDENFNPDDVTNQAESKLDIRPYTMHVGANQNQTVGFTLFDMRTRALELCNVNLETRTGAETAISQFDNAFSKVINFRTELGSIQNRLEKNLEYSMIALENQQNSRSRIEDADMAKEVMGSTKYQMLHQTSMSMLNKARLTPQNLLNLLQ